IQLVTPLHFIRSPAIAGLQVVKVKRDRLPSSVRRDQITLVHCNRSVVKGGDGRRLEAFDDQINAQRKLPYGDRDCEQRCRGGMLPDQTEDHGAVASDQQGRSDESEWGKPPWHQAQLVQQRADQQRIDGRHEAPAEQEDPVIHADQRMAHDQPIRSGSGLLQGDERQDARRAGEEGAAFQGSRADEAERDSLILPLDHREQRDGGADTGEGHDHLQDGADDDAGIRAMPEDVVRSAQRIVEEEGRDRDEAEQVERAGGKGGFSEWTHRKLLVLKVIEATTTDLMFTASASTSGNQPPPQCDRLHFEGPVFPYRITASMRSSVRAAASQAETNSISSVSCARSEAIGVDSLRAVSA